MLIVYLVSNVFKYVYKLYLFYHPPYHFSMWNRQNRVINGYSKKCKISPSNYTKLLFRVIKYALNQ